jgi:phosphate transport system permease protein
MSSHCMLCADTENNMNNTETVKAGLKKRYAREKRFQFYGKAAVMSGFVFLIFLLFDITTKAIPAFSITEILLEV